MKSPSPLNPGSPPLPAGPTGSGFLPPPDAPNSGTGSNPLSIPNR